MVLNYVSSCMHTENSYGLVNDHKVLTFFQPDMKIVGMVSSAAADITHRTRRNLTRFYEHTCLYYSTKSRSRTLVSSLKLIPCTSLFPISMQVTFFKTPSRSKCLSQLDENVQELARKTHTAERGCDLKSQSTKYEAVMMRN